MTKQFRISNPSPHIHTTVRKFKKKWPVNHAWEISFYAHYPMNKFVDA
jgi:hypothetical protein